MLERNFRHAKPAKRGNHMRVLMFGWEFPPYASGGLGTACEGLVRSLAEKGEEIIFVAPKTPKSKNPSVKMVSAMGNVKLREVPGLIRPYMTEEGYYEELKSVGESGDMYGRNLFHEVALFAERAGRIAAGEDFDVIHAHDWLTFQAGIKAKEATGRPLIVHVHATEFDRTGGNGINGQVYALEKTGMEKADRVIAVSNYTKKMITEKYGIDPSKIDVVHNAVEFNNHKLPGGKAAGERRTVLFLGRVTLQKGPDYFIYAARRVADLMPDTRFIIAGSGDMEPFVIEKAAELGLSENVLFAGPLKGEEVDWAYQMADVYVMPSVSEPFGITPLESLRNNVPVIVSKQSGISEVLSHALKVDFWDIDEIANKIISVLSYAELNEELKHNGSSEVRKFSWSEPAGKCVSVYRKTAGDASW